MPEKVKVSVIMPSLNVKEYIDEAVESVREQTLEDIEIICIDARSTDGTREKIAKHAEEDPRIVVIDSPIKSYGHQVNMGLDAAKGEYVAILETDDYVDRDMYGSLYDIASSFGLDYIKCDYDSYFTDENGERVFSRRRVGRSGELYDRPFTPCEHPDVAFDDWYLWNGIYSAKFLKNAGIRFSETPGAAFQDVGFLHRTTSWAKKVRYIDRSLYRYCVSRPGASSKSDKTLFFIRQEYGLLFDEIEEVTRAVKTGEDGINAVYSLLYRRLAKSFARACMDSSDDFLATDDAQEMLGWLRWHLIEGTNRGYVSLDMLPQGLKAAYSHLIPKNDFILYRKNRAYDFDLFLGNTHPVVIFGCGMYGREALQYIRDLGREVSFFMDNSDKLWGKTVEGITVKDPQTIKEMPGDTRFVVANENHAEEIASQINTYVHEERIRIY